MRDHPIGWFGYVLVVWFTYSAVLVVKGVGKPREPISKGIATGAAIVSGLLILGVAVFGA